MYHLTEAYLLAAFICLLAGLWGALVLASTVMPPLLQPQPVAAGNASGFSSDLHSYWHGVLKAAMVFGVSATVIISICAPMSALPRTYGLLLTALAGLMTTCFYGAWLLLRRTAGPGSKLALALGILLGLVLIVALVYVLPGQFTFWPTADY